MRPGWKSTEFWLTLATNATMRIGTLADALPPKYGLPPMAVANGIYALAKWPQPGELPPPATNIVNVTPSER
jgi:hypothetical protein